MSKQRLLIFTARQPITTRDGEGWHSCWRAIGAGILDQFVVVWFGFLDDPNGNLVACSQWVFHDGFESGGTLGWSTTVP